MSRADHRRAAEAGDASKIFAATGAAIADAGNPCTSPYLNGIGALLCGNLGSEGTRAAVLHVGLGAGSLPAAMAIWAVRCSLSLDQVALEDDRGVAALAGVAFGWKGVEIDEGEIAARFGSPADRGRRPDDSLLVHVVADGLHVLCGVGAPGCGLARAFDAVVIDAAPLCPSRTGLAAPPADFLADRGALAGAFRAVKPGGCVVLNALEAGARHGGACRAALRACERVQGAACAAWAVEGRGGTGCDNVLLVMTKGEAAEAAEALEAGEATGAGSSDEAAAGESGAAAAAAGSPGPAGVPDEWWGVCVRRLGPGEGW